jgi:protein-disulfide isomerase
MIGRRRLLSIGASSAILAVLAPRAGSAQQLTPDDVFHDADAPTLGNPNGDVTVVEFFDYQCPYCRKIAPEIQQVVQDDGKVRLVLKDWPVLGPVSIVAARMALAAKYQDKFVQAHDAMIGISSKLTEPRIRELLVGAGIDIDRLDRDLSAKKVSGL